MIMWRIIQHRYNNNNKVRVWKVNDGMCPCCGMHLETIEHLFFECSIAKNRWTKLCQLTRGSGMTEAFHDNLFVTIARAILWNKRCPGNVVLISEIYRTIWGERNAAVFS